MVIFGLKVEKDAKQIEVSYIGYTSQIIELTTENHYNVSLSAGKVIDEVLVIGYGTIKKSDKTGAVTSVNSAELNTGRLSRSCEGSSGKGNRCDYLKAGGDPNGGFSVNMKCF